MPETLDQRLSRARQRSLLICSPIARNPTWQTMQSTLDTVLLLQEHGIRVAYELVIGSSVIEKARNELAARFLATDFTDMLFVDDDMQWDARDVLRLLMSDKALIGGVGRMRCQKPNTDPAVWCWRPLSEKGALRADDFGAVEVLGFGAAFMLVNRGVLHGLASAHPEWAEDAPKDWPDAVRQNYFAFFRQGADDGRPLSEDYVFCERWRALGKSVWVMPDIRLGHVGAYTYAGSVSELLQEG